MTKREVTLSFQERLDRVKKFFNWAWDVDIDHTVESVDVSSNEEGTFFEVVLPTSLYHDDHIGREDPPAKEEHLELDGDLLVANFDQGPSRCLSGELFVADSVEPADLMRSYLQRQELDKEAQ